MPRAQRWLIQLVVFWSVAGLNASLSAQETAGAQTGMTALSTIISEGLDTLSDRALPLLIAMAAIGVLTMAIQQVIKDTLRLHVGFNERHFFRWANARGDSAGTEQLVRLATGGERQALFELPDAGLSAQIANASRVALAFPVEFEALLRLVAGRHADDDIALLVSVVADERKRAQALLEPQDPPGDPGPTEIDQRRREQRLQDADQARTRIGHLLDRNIDAFQIVLASAWERTNKLGAFVLSFLLTVLASWLYLAVSGFWRTLSVAGWSVVAVSVVGGGLLAGFVAPVAKDLVTALQNLRGRV